MQHRSKEEFTGWFLTKRNHFKLWPKFEDFVLCFSYIITSVPCYFLYTLKSNLFLFIVF